MFNKMWNFLLALLFLFLKFHSLILIFFICSLWFCCNSNSLFWCHIFY